jgi:hypothetical protein
MKKLFIALLFAVTASAYGGDGWYFADNCESIKRYQMVTPLQLMSEYGCKPTINKSTESSAEMGMLAFDCSQSDLKGYINLVYTKNRCDQLQEFMKNRR